MFKYIFLFCSFLLAVTFLFKITEYFLSVFFDSSKKKSFTFSGEIVFPVSFIFFSIILMTLTSSAYYFIGRSDLLQGQLPQEILENSFTEHSSYLETEELENEILFLYNKLQQTLVTRPKDIEGHKLLVTTSISLKKYSNARKAQENIIKLTNPNTTKKDYILYLDVAFMAAGGRVSLEASRTLRTASALYPKDEIILFFKALEYLERRDYQQAVNIWKFLRGSNKIDKRKLNLLQSRLSALKIVP